LLSLLSCNVSTNNFSEKLVFSLCFLEKKFLVFSFMVYGLFQ
jgi:hypothetical protein